MNAESMPGAKESEDVNGQVEKVTVVLLLSETTRRTAAFGRCTSTSGRIWAGGGSMSPKGTTPTSAPGRVRTSAAPTPHTAR